MKKTLTAACVLFAGVVALTVCRNKTDVPGDRAQASADRVSPVRQTFSPSAAAGLASAGATNGVNAAALSARGTKAVRISSDRTMTAAVRRELAAMGVRIIGPIGAKAVAAEVTPEVGRAVAASGRFATEDVLPQRKIQSQLAEKCAKAEGRRLPVLVEGLSAEDRAGLQAWVVAQGGVLRDCATFPSSLCAEIPAELVASLAERGDVRWIEYAPEAKVLNDLTAAEGAANVAVARTEHMLNGKGQVVAVYDSGFDTGSLTGYHADFTGRVLALVNAGKRAVADYNGHGTHVAGTVLGDGTMSDGQYQGMAPRAKLYVQGAGDEQGSSSIYTPGTYEAIFASGLLAANAFIHSDSWGSDTAGEYTEKCKGLDQVVWNHPELLVVVAAGNAGAGGKDASGDGSVGSPAAAKNALTVGNTMSTRPSGSIVSELLEDSPENMNYSSSRGPTKDQRIKPEIAAPGTAVRSTLSSMTTNCEAIADNPYYTEMTGTSMATPLVSGAAALTRQWLADRRQCKEPTAALLKAILTGGGEMMTGSWLEITDPTSDPPAFELRDFTEMPVPNNVEGWGRINLNETLYPSNRRVKLADRIPFADGSVETIDVTTQDDAGLDVQLVWTDYPADLTAEQTLVNDLDLIVSNKTTGAVWYGNDIEGGDHTNTVESVRIAEAPAGDYAVLVLGRSVPHDSTEGGAAAVYIRAAMAEDESTRTERDPQNVRIAGREGFFETLDDALAATASGDTVEILAACSLEKSVSLASSCTIVAVADGAFVTRLNDAALELAEGATVALSNLVFRGSSEPMVKVFQGGQLVLLPGVDLGVGSDAVSIWTEAADGLLLAAPLTQALTVRCVAAQHVEEPFALYDGVFFPDLAMLAETAQLIVSAWDETRETRGAFGTVVPGTLVWKKGGCPLSDAAGSFAVGDVTNAYARLDVAVEELEKALADGASVTEFVIRKSDALSKSLTVAKPLAIRCEGEVEVVCGPGAGFTVTGALTVEAAAGGSLSFVGGSSRTRPLFLVDGGDLTLGSGVVVHDVSGVTTWKHSSALHVKKGKATVDGATFERCANLGTGFGGGAISVGEPESWKAGDGYELVLASGCITNCSAKAHGGGVYAYSKAKVTVGGTRPLRVAGNVAGTSEPKVTENVYLSDTNVVLTLAGSLTPVSDGIGICRGGNGGEGNAIGATFAQMPDASVFDAARWTFFNDAHPDYEVTTNGNALVWQAPAVPDYRTDDPELAVVRVRRAGSDIDGGQYAHIAYALEALKAGGAAAATIELLKDASVDENFVVDFPLTICSTGTVARTVMRSEGARFVVSGAASSLTLTNAVFGGRGREGLFSVDGGTMTLQAGAAIRGAVGSAARESGAVSVWNGGTFYMERGAAILGCTNLFSNAGTKSGYGGALLLDNATAYLRGGVVSNCVAGSAGGVFANNESKVYVSGDTAILGNANLAGAKDNLRVAEDSQLWVDAPFDGAIGYHGSARSASGDVNVFGYAKSGTGLTETNIADAATRFFHDETDDRGQAVHATGSSQYRLVWSAAVVDGEYGGYVLSTAGTPVPVAKPTAAEGLVYTGAEQVGVAEGTGYDLSGVSRAVAATPLPTDPPTNQYQSVATLRKGYVWSDGSAQPVTNFWSIAKADPDLSGFSFKTNFVYDGQYHCVTVEGTLPAGVTVQFVGNEGEKLAGTNQVGATFAVADTNNYNDIPSQELLLIIERATYDMSGVSFPDGDFMYDGTKHSISIAGALPDGVTAAYVGNGQYTSGVYTVTAVFTGDAANYEAIPDMTATLKIMRNPDMPVEIVPGPSPVGPTVVTNTPVPVAFQSIARVDETTWALVVTNRVPYCNYRLLYTDDLTKGFVNTGAWEQAVGTEDDVRVWSTNVNVGSVAVQMYWKAEATEGTNVVETAED